MDIEMAKLVIDKFCRDFNGYDFEAIKAMPEGTTAVELYLLALGWLIETDRWQVTAETADLCMTEEPTEAVVPGCETTEVTVALGIWAG